MRGNERHGQCEQTPRVYRGLTQFEGRLHGETNIESILALEGQIREYEVTLKNLKRARNSLLNISKLPPEVLGNIFRWNVTFNDDFGGLGKESHNFLLVCHHWFEVASSTPEIWSFWGNTPKDWARWFHHSGTAPLDLVLEPGDEYDPFDAVVFEIVLFDALKDRATRDTIRRIHLKATDSVFLNSVISSLTTTSKELQLSSVESFIFRNGGNELVDISDFFTHHCYPRLQRLELFTCKISSWDLITSRVTALTTLDLNFYSLEPPPTISETVLLLTSNPTLRKVSLFGYGVGTHGDRNHTLRVPLRHLKELKLDGDLQDVFGLLNKLDHPRRMDHLDITLDACEVEDVSQTIGPYVRNYLRHHGAQGGLGLSLPSWNDIDFHVGDVDGIDFSVPAPARMDTFMKFSIEFDRTPPNLDKVTLDLIAHVPREEIVYFQAQGTPLATEDVSAQFPNLRGLRFEKTPLSVAFPKVTPDRNGEVFPSLRYISLDQMVMSGGDGWEPLSTFLLRRVRAGRRLHSLVIVGPYRVVPITPEMVGEYRLNP